MTVICNYYYEFSATDDLSGRYCDNPAEHFYKSPQGYQQIGLLHLGDGDMLAARCFHHQKQLLPALHLEITEAEYIVELVMEE